MVHRIFVLTLCNWWNQSDVVSQTSSSFELHCDINTRIHFLLSLFHLSNRQTHFYIIHPTYNIFIPFSTSGNICILSLLIWQNPDIFAIFNIWRNSLLLINQSSADSRWTAGIRVYSLKGNVQTSAFDE